MAIEFKNTEYQLGTLIYWELCKPENAKSALAIMLHVGCTRIVEDDSEAWMKDFSPEKIVSVEEAAAALLEARGGPEWKRDYAIINAAETYLKEQEALLAKLVESEKEFKSSLGQVLGRSIEQEDMDAAVVLHAKRKSQLAARSERYAKANPKKLSWEMGVTLRNRTAGNVKAQGLKFSEEASERAARLAVAERERHAMEKMRATINYVEKKRNHQ